MNNIPEWKYCLLPIQKVNQRSNMPLHSLKVCRIVSSYLLAKTFLGAVRLYLLLLQFRQIISMRRHKLWWTVFFLQCGVLMGLPAVWFCVTYVGWFFVLLAACIILVLQCYMLALFLGDEGCVGLVCFYRLVGVNWFEKLLPQSKSCVCTMFKKEKNSWQ